MTKSKKTKGQNAMELIDFLAEAYAELSGYLEEREHVSAKIMEVRDRAKARGIPKKAFDQAMVYSRTDPEKRKEHDVAYAACRAALDLPVQDDLFAAADRLGKSLGADADADADAGE